MVALRLWLMNVQVLFEKRTSLVHWFQSFGNLVSGLQREEASWHYDAGWIAVDCLSEGLTSDVRHP